MSRRPRLLRRLRAGGWLALLLWALPVQGAEEEPLRLGLRETVLLALERNPELRVERADADARQTLPEEARAAFDPTVSAEFSHREAQFQTTARQDALESRTASTRLNRVDQGEVSVVQPLPTGTEVTLSAQSVRSRSNFSDEEIDSRVELGVRQPLLQGRSRDANLASVRIAENDAAVGRHAFVAALQDLLAGVESAYWDLCFALRQIEVRGASLEAARVVQEETRALVSSGRRPSVELAAAAAEVAAREEALEDALGFRESARLELLRWLEPGDDISWSARIDPADEAGSVAEPPPPDEAVLGALARRPDLLQARLDLDSGELRVVETRDGLLPQLDLFASYAQTGLGRNFGDSWDTLGRERYQDWRLGVRFEMPIGLRAEKARARRTDFERDRARAAVENLELLVVAQVRKALAEEGRLARKVGLARATADARAEETRAEGAKFDAGRATAGDVLQAETRQREAELAWHRARVDLRKARSERLRLEGRLVEEWRLDVE